MFRILHSSALSIMQTLPNIFLTFIQYACFPPKYYCKPEDHRPFIFLFILLFI